MIAATRRNREGEPFRGLPIPGRARRFPTPFLKITQHIFVSASFALIGPAIAQDFSKVEIRTEKLSATTYMLQGSGGNIGLSIGEDAVFVIDDQYAPLTPKIKEAIAKLTPNPVQFVLNTHYHSDHTGGNENFAREGVLIVAHDNVRKRMSSEQLIGFLGMKQAASPRTALPAVTFGGDITFHINGEEVFAFHVPRAHTDGDTIIHFRRGDVIHMGDTFFNGFYPFIDAASGGTADGVIAAADRVLAIATDETRIIPGHGPLATRKDLQTYRDLLATVTQRIKDLRKAGKSDTEIKAAQPSQQYDDKYGRGFFNAERFVDMMLGVIPK
jgi:glyoxylase-like metal-dependent hydrolase (beta-lactamase superfamily II)